MEKLHFDIPLGKKDSDPDSFEIDPERLAYAKPIIDSVIGILPAPCHISSVDLHRTDLWLMIEPVPEFGLDEAACHELILEALNCVHRAHHQIGLNAQETKPLPLLNVACVTKPALNLLKDLSVGAVLGVAVNYKGESHVNTLPMPPPEYFPDVKKAKASKSLGVPTTPISGCFMNESSDQRFIILPDKTFVEVPLAEEKVFSSVQHHLEFEGTIHQSGGRNSWEVVGEFRIGDETFGGS